MERDLVQGMEGRVELELFTLDVGKGDYFFSLRTSAVAGLVNVEPSIARKFRGDL